MNASGKTRSVAPFAGILGRQPDGSFLQVASQSRIDRLGLHAGDLDGRVHASIVSPASGLRIDSAPAAKPALVALKSLGQSACDAHRPTLSRRDGRARRLGGSGRGALGQRGTKRGDAEAAEGFTDVGTVRELVAASEIVISLCPPAIAEAVAGEVAAERFDGIYVEANAITPERTRADRRLLRLVDGMISGTGRTSTSRATQQTSPRSPRSSRRAS